MPIVGHSSLTNADSALAGSGTVPVQATSTLTCADSSQAGTGAVPLNGTSSATLADSALAGAGNSYWIGTSTLTTDDATLAAAGTIPVHGASSLNCADSISSSGLIPVNGNSSLTPDCVLAGDAAVLVGGAITVHGSSSLTLDSAALIGACSFSLNGSSTLGLVDAVLAGAASLTVHGTSTLDLVDVMLSGASSNGVHGSANWTTGGATVSGGASAASGGSFSPSCAIFGQAVVRVQGAGSLTTDDCAVAGSQQSRHVRSNGCTLQQCTAQTRSDAKTLQGSTAQVIANAKTLAWTSMWVRSDAKTLQGSTAHVRSEAESIQICLATGATGDGSVTATPIPSASPIWRVDTVAGNGTTRIEVASPPIVSFNGQGVTVEFPDTGAIIRDGGATISEDGLAVILTEPFPSSQTLRIYYNTGDSGDPPTPLFTLISAKPACSLSGIDNIKDFFLIQAMNQGWNWGCVVPGYLGDPVSLGEATLALNRIWTMQIQDGRGGYRTSPPLVACTGINWSYGDGQSVTILSGTDLTTWKLSQPHQSVPKTFRNLYSNTVIETISTLSGVRITPPAINFPVAEEDVKQSTWWAVLQRIAEVAICNLVVDPNGSLRFVPLRWTAERCNFIPKQVNYNAAPDKRVTGFVVSKKTSHYTADQVPDKPYTFDTPGVKVQQLRVPVIGPKCQDQSTMGACGSVGFWTDDPSKPGAGLITFNSLNDNSYGATLSVPQIGIGTAKFMTLAVYPGSPPLDSQTVQAKLRVSGSTPPTVAGLQLPGLDLAFTTTVGTIKGTNARPGPVRNEALYPSKAYTDANAGGLLLEANKESQKVETSGAMDCSARLGGLLVMELPESVPSARIERIEERGSDAGFECSIEAFPVQW